MLRHVMFAVVATVMVAATSLAAYGQDVGGQATGSLPSPFLLQQDTVQDQLRALPAVPGRLFAGPSQDEKSTGFATQKSTTPGVSRARSTEVDSSYLRRLVGAERLQVSAAGQFTNAPARFTLNLFENAAPTVVALDSTIDGLGHRVVRGTVVGGGMAILVIDGGTVTGHITSPEGTFTVTPAGGGLHRIVEVDHSTERRREDDGKRPPRTESPGSVVPKAPRPAVEKSSAVEKASAAYTLRILAVYPASVTAALPTFKTSLSLYLAYLNTAFTNSQIDAVAEIVGIEQTTYTESGTSLDPILDDVTEGVGDFSRIQEIRAAVGADIIAYFTSISDTSACGLAWLNDDLDEYSNLASATQYGTGVTSMTCTDIAEIFAHEVGHNMGGRHDRYVVDDDQPGPTEYNYGYVDTTNRFRDIMSYSNKCTAQSVTCEVIPYFSNPDVSYSGAPVGIAASNAEAAHVSRRVREILPYLTDFRDLLDDPPTPYLSVLVSGTGTVTSSPNGISCGATCSKSFSGSQSVTLTPVAASGWKFKQWGGSCSGSGACTVAVSTSKSVTATFVQAVTYGPVFAGGMSPSQSFIRVANTGSTAGTVKISLSNYTTGAFLTEWTSSSIAAGATPQFGIGEIEAGVSSASKPLYYMARIEPNGMTGYTQHVLWKPSDGTLTNLSTCDANVTANRDMVANVHSSLVGALGYPSSIAITNTDTSSGTAELGIYSRNDNVRLGTYTTLSIRGKGQVILPIDTIESGASITPSASRDHYTIRIENGFTGFLQHLVNNQQAAVITDMTTVCALDTVASPSATASLLQSGPIYSTAQSANRSFLRFVNTGSTAGTAAVTLRDYATGTKLGQWTSPSIPAGAAPQYAIADLEATFSGTPPQYYSTEIESTITGLFAHVLWKPAQGTLTNLSTCGAGVEANATIVFDVHSSIVGGLGYPSSVVVNNTGSTAAPVTLGIFHGRTAARLGTYVSSSVPANGQLFLAIDTIEIGAGITASSAVDHYVVKIESTFTGFLQHLVNNEQAAVLTDMTTVCRLPAKSVTYADCRPSSSTTCTVQVGTPLTGQLKEVDSYSNYDVTLTGGRAYTIDIKGASTSNGTLTKPYMFVLSPSGGSVAQGGGGGTGNDARLTFTPSTTGTYTIQVTAYVYSDNAGSFVLSVQ